MALEFKKVSPEMRKSLEKFFNDLKRSGDDRYFHPHRLDRVGAAMICKFPSEDLYYVATYKDRIMAYGMLRGWAEGYEIPSLGIAVHKPMRGTKLAKAFMHFLHAAAWINGADKVRLKVHPKNAPAVKLYKSLGYKFQKKMEDKQLVGFFDLMARKTK